MAELTYTDLPAAILERPDQGNVAEVGVVVEGAFIPIARIHLGDMHQAIHDAAKAKADQAEQQPQPPPPPEQPAEPQQPAQ